MSLLIARERRMSLSDGELNLRGQMINYTIANDYEKLLGIPTTYTNIKPENKTKKKKDSRVQTQGISTLLLTSTKRRRRKESVIMKKLPCEIEEINAENAYMLRLAVRKCDTKRVIELVSCGMININAADQRGITALHEAAIDGNLVCANILVTHGAHINEKDIEGYTPLDYAVFAGNFECASYLIEKGAREDRIRDGQIVCKQITNNKSRSVTFC